MTPADSAPHSASAIRADRIAQSATALFARNGYASTSVDDIVTAAEVSKPRLYQHFGSKQDLCIQLLERYRDELIAATLSRFTAGAASGPPARSFPGSVPELIDAWLGWVREHPDAARLLFTPILGDPRVQEVQRDLYERQRATQSALLREFAPGLSEAAAEPLAEITRAGFAAIALWWLDHPHQPQAVPRDALMAMAEGVIGSANRQVTGGRRDPS